jgi:hypothetical protein
VNFGDSLHLGILKEALMRAIHDIDGTFSKASSIHVSLLVSELCTVFFLLLLC